MARVPQASAATCREAGNREGPRGGEHEALSPNVHGSFHVQQGHVDVEGEEGSVRPQRDVEQPPGPSSRVLPSRLRRACHVQYPDHEGGQAEYAQDVGQLWRHSGQSAEYPAQDHD